MDARLDLLVEIEDVVVARTYSKRRVRHILMLETEEQFRTSLHLQLYTARTEDFVCRTDVEFHIRDVKLLLIVMLHFTDFLLPVLVHDFSFGILVILLLREHVWRGHIGLSYARVQDICACLRLILNASGDIRRIVQVHRTVRQIQVIKILRAELLHLRRCPNGAVRRRSSVCQIRRFCRRTVIRVLCSLSRSRSVFLRCFLRLFGFLRRLFLRFLLRNQFFQRLGLLSLLRNSPCHCQRQQHKQY